MLSVGLTLAVLSGICNGLFTAPMKLERRWKWENIWMVFILTSCVVMPVAMLQITAPGFSRILALAPPGAVLAACVFGFIWGFGAICTGRSVELLGVSLANSLLLGVSSALGSVVPLIMTHPKVSPIGLTTLLAGILTFLIGVVLCGAAGRMRDSATTGSTRPSKAGYFYALASGVISAIFNIGYTLALPIAQTGSAVGFDRAAGTNCIWLLMLGAGAIPNLAYCGLLMSRNGTLSLLWSGAVLPSWGRSVGMGLLWGGSIFLYGVATPRLGDLGPSVGWPFSLAVALVVANFMGVLLHEWRGASRPARKRMYQGIWTLLVAIALCAIATRSGS